MQEPSLITIVAEPDCVTQIVIFSGQKFMPFFHHIITQNIGLIKEKALRQKNCAMLSHGTVLSCYLLNSSFRYSSNPSFPLVAW